MLFRSANSDQLDFPVLYASGRSGWCVTDLDNERNNLTPLLDQVISHVPSPDVDNSKPFAMLSTLLDSDPYLGRCLVGRVEQGSAKINDSVHALNLSGQIVETGRLTKLLKFEGMKKIPVGSFWELPLSKQSPIRILGEKQNEISTDYFLILREDRKSTRLNSSHSQQSRMPSSA